MQQFGLVPLAGGHSGETFLADAAGERTVVRVYGARSGWRGPAAAEVDAAVLALVRGLVPVPEVHEVRRGDPVSGTPPLLVTSFLPGVRLDLLLPDLDGLALSRLGRAMGELVARLAQMPLPRPGLFADGDLRIEPMPPEHDLDLVALVESRRPGTALADWPAAAYDALLEVADKAQAVLDGESRTCLVHSDLNPKNLLVDPETLQVTGVLDWEFAHAGLPVTDLGNLLRFDRDPAFAEAVLGVYRDSVPDAGDDPLTRARAADVRALVDLAARRGESPVTEQAHALLVAIASSGDLHAVPPTTP